jgi:hypothetical protein
MTMLPNLVFVMFLLIMLMISPTMATKSRLPCNFCSDGKKVTQPKAKFTLVQVLGLVPITVSCGYWDYLMKSGVSEARCVFNQNNEYRQASCGCA